MSLGKLEKIQPCRVVLDLNHWCYRSWAANGTLANSRGELTGAIFGSLKGIVALCKNFSPQQLIAAVDTPNPFRRGMYPAYKAHRTDENRTPAEISAKRSFHEQLASLETVLLAAGIPVLRVPELEADDVAALVAHKIPFTGTTVLVSGDKDFIQLVRPGVVLFSPVMEKLLRHDGPEFDDWGVDGQRVWEKAFEVGPRTFTRFIEKLPRGVGLDRWLLYRALVGDSSDNLAGVHGIGPSAALKTVEAFCSLDGLKEAGSQRWKNVLNRRQCESLSTAFENGDLEAQYHLIDLSALPRLEGAGALAETLEAEMQAVIPDEQSFRKQLIRWEMTSMLVNWKRFLLNFPAFQKQTPGHHTREPGACNL